MQAIRDAYGTHRATPEVWRDVIATYHGMVSRLDAHVGRLLAAVRRAGAADDTVTVFFADHGEYLGDFGLIEKWPTSLHACITRDPLIISGGGLPAAGTVDAMVEIIDVFPTVLDVAGVHAGHHHFGRSLLPLLHDPAAPHREYAFRHVRFVRPAARRRRHGYTCLASGSPTARKGSGRRSRNSRSQGCMS